MAHPRSSATEPRLAAQPPRPQGVGADGPARASTVGQFCFPELTRANGPETPPPPAAPPTMTLSEHEERLAAAQTAAADAAEAAARQAMAATIEHRLAAAMERLGHDLAAAQAAFAEHLRARATASRELALALAGVLVPRALEQAPLADLEAMLTTLLPKLEALPALRLRLPPALLPLAEPRLRRLIERAGYQGDLQLVADPELGPGDAKLIWQDGMACRDLAALERELQPLIDAWWPVPATSRPSSATTDGLCDE